MQFQLESYIVEFRSWHLKYLGKCGEYRIVQTILKRKTKLEKAPFLSSIFTVKLVIGTICDWHKNRLTNGTEISQIDPQVFDKRIFNTCSKVMRKE